MTLTSRALEYTSTYSVLKSLFFLKQSSHALNSTGADSLGPSSRLSNGIACTVSMYRAFPSKSGTMNLITCNVCGKRPM